LNVPEDQKHLDEELVTNSLGKLAKGTGILFFAMIMGIFFNFLARVIIARFYTPDDYGLFNLFFTILSIFAGIAFFGLGSGMPRFIGHYTGSGEKHKIRAMEGWSLLIGLVSGISFSILLFFLAPWIAPLFSEENVFIDYMRIAAVTLPFFVILNSLITIFRGHQRTIERILFYDFGMNLTFLIFSFIISILALPFIGVIWSMFAAIVLITISFFIYYLNQQKSLLKNFGSYSFNPSLGKEILIFSLPLLLVDILTQSGGWVSTLMIGYFISASAVGYYQVAYPLSVFIATGLTVSGFLYAPLVASLYSQRKFNETKEIYSTLTKWICFLTLPLAMVLFFFPETIISVFFGVDYISAAIPLKILSIAFFINTMTGPDGAVLIAYGETKFLMYATTGNALINILLNFIIIPNYGIIGAAFTTGFSLILVNIIRISKLFAISGVHSLKPKNLKPIISTVFFGSILVIALTYLPILGILQAIIAFVLLSILFLLMMLLTHSVSKQDINLLKLIEKKIRINLSFVERLIIRFE
jgi:O-antigen/teichoic acid export membrane protein